MVSFSDGLTCPRTPCIEITRARKLPCRALEAAAADAKAGKSIAQTAHIDNHIGAVYDLTRAVGASAVMLLERISVVEEA
mmetsp:Transcript_35490/g.98074  ORF Transcript_35490/g.98074 Transcript_35490/m.98074 type:complete len:80 (+) Transcript_35490:112-351(+)